jgi:hypothetical protein
VVGAESRQFSRRATLFRVFVVTAALRAAERTALDKDA